ncbi:conserved protein of unknown function (plasmid) [Rhodovastum atsumiense]|uniref:Uncharacterized protein n=1 Tax=Rhodovastum atsumiense TaxID=504468 RepID=A0A5M6IJS6_9PROT|nr:hypothetical protein [Rhodovastum atsumiense]KAA5607935.1 hypothetical protein F1189_31505 [Rhodovastum atsumiense]CAH2605939.1 conserved protein of unknown function [Rhodovastum atsumiense]
MVTTLENSLMLVAHSRRMLTEIVCAGSSLLVRPPCFELRNYSLCDDNRERYRYVIAVKREAASRGSSRSMHESALG